jgi:hypothetical protein
LKQEIGNFEVASPCLPSRPALPSALPTGNQPGGICVLNRKGLKKMSSKVIAIVIAIVIVIVIAKVVVILVVTVILIATVIMVIFVIIVVIRMILTCYAGIWSFLLIRAVECVLF